ncbi:tagaturonate reductase [Aristaeella lactis]|uniref:Tagaturonate reductase n=1 Tax=Aristaeella lactis TaxID=3046383 RepID=A0AC61PN31_9FIRM|nr:tagaturonate reductase [Aristaeella lactis]QUA52809.1 tagaturonate reductase [Aristaeella lactis]SMC73822.1 tagaturonate reductase [Aristaeella lactis]
MAQLNYRVLEQSGYDGFILKNAPEKVMQFGEGNFLRAFADNFFDIANEKAGFNGKVALIQPIAQGLTDLINKQEGLYTLYLRGSDKGVKVDEKRVISAVSRCINPYGDWDKVLELARSADLEIVVSNTTEAGIVHDTESAFDQEPPVSFPAKLTRVLYERYTAGQKGVVVLSCELIDNNGRELQKCVNQYIDDWKLDSGFRTWVNEENLFCSTLVDRIVPGRIRDPKEAEALAAANGYEDPLTDVGEFFGIWVIEGPQELEERLPFRKAGVPVIVVPDVTPYKKRKVRILNGAHTGFVPGAYLAGYDIVRDCMHDETILGYMNRMLYDEVIPTLPLEKKDLEDFARAVQDRFNNPFVNHELMSISLNSTSKWRARNMPSFLDYVQGKGTLPPCLTTSFAAYVAFYSSESQALTEQGLICRRPKGNEYTVNDDRSVLEFYWQHRNDSPEELIHAVMTNEDMWGTDLTKVNGFEAAAAGILKTIRTEGALKAFENCLA